MKRILLTLSLLASTYSFAGIGPVDYGVEGLMAANLMRAPGIQKCFKVLENGGGVAQVLKLTEVNTADKNLFLLDGSTVYGDIMAGSWEMTINVRQELENTVYHCNLTKNEE